MQQQGLKLTSGYTGFFNQVKDNTKLMAKIRGARHSVTLYR